ncbi:MAG: ATP-binding cassette domain-containing protein [Boseongicola sp. SB0673_bin_14]|nr:ATP-binding cassette domain-containing protein [Boseongicola sp. SB0673_bin_14]
MARQATSGSVSPKAVRVPRFRRRPRRTPLMMQLESTDCGAACLGIVLAHHGCWTSLEELREQCGVGRDGSSLKDIAQAARGHGLEATGHSCEIHQLAALPLPLVLFWGFNHFVVLEGMAGDRFLLNDPAEGHRSVGLEEFDRHFTGVSLLLEPGSGFRRRGARRSVVQRLWPWLRGHRALLARTTALGLLLAIVLLALPLLLALFVDRVLDAGQAGLGWTLAAGTLLAGAAAYLLTWLQMRSLRDLVIRLSITQSDRFLDTLLHLPVRFFSHRLAGDLALRLRTIDQVADTGAGQLVRLSVDLIMSAAFLAVMLAWHWPLAFVVAGMGASCLVMTRLLARLRRDHSHRLRREQSMLAGVSAAGLSSVESLQATARENDFFSDWSGRQARELVARQEFVELGHVASSFPHLFQLLNAAAVFGLGGWLMTLGHVTLGQLMGFYILADNFIRPVARIGQLSDMLETLEADLTRMDDVINAPSETAPTSGGDGRPRMPVNGEGGLRLIGRLEMKGVSFGYQRNRDPLVRDFSLTIEPGQRVALVGESGSGKSTVAQLVAGLHLPWSGEILFDGHPAGDVPREVFCRSVSIVDQSPVLFAATVRDNLTMWDATVPDHHVTAAARDARIHEEIISRPQGYDSMVEEGGRNFSGGQRLRLEIARALVSRPSLMIMDEATSALDPVTELMIDDSIRRRGCSCLIVAHRLSTIRDADRIMVVDGGRIVGQGSHDELYAREGIYRRLLDGE